MLLQVGTSNDLGLSLRLRLIGARLISVPAWPALVLLVLAAGVLQPSSMTFAFLLIVLRQAVPLGIAALGQGLTIIGRSIDLTVGGVIAVSNVLLATDFMVHGPAWLSIVLPLLLGGVVGALNAFFIARMRASAVIVTLGVSVALVGISYLVSGGAPGGDVQPVVKWLAGGRVGGLPIAVIIWAVLAISMTVLLRRLVFGRYLYAVGANYRAAELGGIPANGTLAVAHILSGICAGAAGLLLTGYIGTGTIDLGEDLVLASVAACILGGVTFGGGRGNLLGTAGGAFVLVLLGTLLTALGVAAPVKLIVQGLIVALAAAAAAAAAAGQRSA
jgi:ribose transport system permease protein